MTFHLSKFAHCSVDPLFPKLPTIHSFTSKCLVNSITIQIVELRIIILTRIAPLVNESEDSAQEEVTMKPKKASAKKQIEEELESVAEQNGDEDMADAIEDDEGEDDDDGDEEKLVTILNPLLS